MMKIQLHRLKRKMPFYLDQVMAPFINPQDGVIITGFWRSGTTWLERWMADVLHAKTIFEPLEVDVRKHYRLQDELHLPSNSDLYLKAHMPFAEDEIPRNSNLYRLLEDALRGKVPGKRVRINRNGMADSFRRRVVVKHVRGQLAVHGLYKTFLTPILHIYRDPRAVIASLIRNDWGGEWMHILSLRAQLLEPQDGRCLLFEQWSDDLDYFDSQPWWERAIVYWALTETYLRSCALRFQFPIRFLNYETLVTEEPSMLVNTLRELGLTVPPTPANWRWAESSPTTVQERRDADAHARVSGWKNELSPQMAERTVEIVHRFGFTEFS
jgi:hypothetical protein